MEFLKEPNSAFDQELKDAHTRYELGKLRALEEYQKAEVALLSVFRQEVEDYALRKLGYVPETPTPTEYRRLMAKYC